MPPQGVKEKEFGSKRVLHVWYLSPKQNSMEGVSLCIGRPTLPHGDHTIILNFGASLSKFLLALEIFVLIEQKLL